jgi:hypothetical protein
MTVKLHSRTPSLLQDSTSLPAFLILTAKSGFKRETKLCMNPVPPWWGGGFVVLVRKAIQTNQLGLILVV